MGNVCRGPFGFKLAAKGEAPPERVKDGIATQAMTELVPTPNDCPLPRRRADFATFTDAIDYAAQSLKGLNFHDARGTLVRVYPYSEMRAEALQMAYRLLAAGIGKGDRVAIVAETGTEFAALFCGAVYAGAWPVPLPLPTTFGGRENYIEQLAVQLESSEPKLLLYPAEIAEMASAAAKRQGCEGIDWESFCKRPAREVGLPQAQPDDICYLQYSSGSTRFPTGVAVTHRALLHNLYGHAATMNLGTGDRGISWLPWYHDMGLVGCLLSMIANQISADYLKTEHFARRPLAWLDLISRNEGNSLSYSPTFGYDICARRISSQSSVAERFDLSRPARYRAIVNCGKPLPDMDVEIRGENGKARKDHQIGKVFCRGPSVMHSYFRNPEATEECLVDGWLDTGDMGYMADCYLFIVGRAKDMIIINGKNHWPQDIEWAVEQLPGFNHGDIAAFSVETESGEEAPAVLVHCRVSDPEERVKLRDAIRDKVRSITGMNCVVELVPPRTLPRTSSGKLSRAKAKRLYLSGEIEPFDLAA